MNTFLNIAIEGLKAIAKSSRAKIWSTKFSARETLKDDKKIRTGQEKAPIDDDDLYLTTEEGNMQQIPRNRNKFTHSEPFLELHDEY